MFKRRLRSIVEHFNVASQLILRPTSPNSDCLAASSPRRRRQPSAVRCATISKNASTDSAKAVRLLRANNRLALSGTPIENRLGDLWSLFEFLNPWSAWQCGRASGTSDRAT
jgi:hypothetical protein